MTPELHVLDDALRHSGSGTVWCADENTAGFIPSGFTGSILTNRFDIYQQLEKLNPNTFFNDFDFQALPCGIDTIIFRIAKEKALNLHIVSQAFARLRKGHRLVLIGYKNEGMDSLAAYIKDNFTSDFKLQKHKAQLRCLEFIAPGFADIDRAVIDGQPQDNPPKNANNYADILEVSLNDTRVFSKPGVFGWNKLDRGSALLMAAFSRTAVPADNRTILDLGCGYGYLSIKARQAGFIHIDATDNNAAAVIACQQNFAHWDISGTVFADNHAEHCTKKYDIVLCNPPFHQGFDHRKQLIDIFIKQSFHLLKPKGEAYFVVNQFIGLEKIAAELFEKCELLDKTEGFKVFLFKKK